MEVGIALSHSPNFLQTNTIVLDAGIVLFEVEVLLDSLGERTSAPLRENGLLCLNLNTRLIVILMSAILSDTEISSNHTSNTAILVVNDLVTSDARQNIYTHRFCLFAQPNTEVAQTDDEIAMIVNTRWQKHVWNINMFFFKQDCEFVFSHRSSQRCLIIHKNTQNSYPLFFPIRNQLIKSFGLEDVSRQDMRTDLRTFLNEAHRYLFIVLLLQLFHSNCSRQAYLKELYQRRDLPAGPPPTISTSYSMESLSI